MSRYVFGVDIGGTSVKIGLFEESGTLLEKWEIPTRKEENGAYILSDIGSSIGEQMEKRAITKDDIIGVGVGSPGIVDKKGIVHAAVNLGWNQGSVDIPQQLGKMLGGVCVKAENDANAAAYGEMWKGAGAGSENLVMVTLGTGVGGGIITDGRILRGAGGAGGEIGHIHVEDQEETPCPCGSIGCLEQYASATGIVKLARKVLEGSEKPSSLRTVEKLSAKEIFDAVKQGDEVAIEIAGSFGTYLGKGLSIIASIVDPDLFVIGGGVSYAGEILFDFIRPAFIKYANDCTEGIKLQLAQLGNDAGIYGAAGLWLALQP